MAKYTDDYVLDGAATRISEGNQLRICAGQPTSFADSTTRNLGSIAMTTGLGTHYTLANGDVSGRKVTVAARSAISITASGTADHVAIVDTVNSRLLHVTTMPAQAVTSGNTANTAAWDAEFADVTP